MGQKDTALKVTKAKLASVTQEFDEFKAAASHWQQDAERKVSFQVLFERCYIIPCGLAARRTKVSQYMCFLIPLPLPSSF